MTENLDYISDLIEKHLQNRLTDAEKDMLEQWVQESEDNHSFLTELNDDKLLTLVAKFYRYKAKREKIAQRIAEHIPEFNSPIAADLASEANDLPAIFAPAVRVHRIHFLKTSWFRYAAVVILVIGVTAAILLSSNQQSKNQGNGVVAAVSKSEDIQPGTNRAILTIGNNKPIDLSDDKTGIVVGTAITYNDGEQIANAGQMLQLSTPRGGQYQAVLPDGSQVWLNAASSIRLPSKFDGDKRAIEITGEVYLEVAKNPKQSFVVNANGTEIQVLGTSFNVNAYSDESVIKTTLVSGSVKVRDVILKPGQQVVVMSSAQQLKKQDEIIRVQTANIEQTLAWKNGVFQFSRTGLADVMRQLARWYDLEVVYENGVPDIQLDGEMKRSLTLSQLLKGLDKLGVKFRMEERRLIIMQ